MVNYTKGIPTNNQLPRLNKNTLVLLTNDNITRENVATNLNENPHTTFLCPTNATVDIINSHAIDILFAKDQLIRYVVNGFKTPMPIYENMTIAVTENRYIPFIILRHLITQ